MEAQEAIRQWMAEGGRKFGWLAAQIPVGASDLSRWMNSKVIPRPVYRARLSDITGLDVSDAANWGKAE